MNKIVHLLRVRAGFKQKVEYHQGLAESAKWSHDQADKELQQVVLKSENCQFLIDNILHKIVDGKLTVEVLERFYFEPEIV